MPSLWYNKDMPITQDEQPGIDFVSHLTELRQRLMYALLAVGIGCVAGWYLYPWGYHLLVGPVFRSIAGAHGVIITQHPAEAFFIRLKMTGVFGLLLASPFILWQGWVFIRPGLTERERRGIGPIVPLVSVLFGAGAVIAYLLMPSIMAFFLAYIPANVLPYMDFEQSINFPLKVIVAFGLAFQLPIVVLGLVVLRILSPQVLLKQWRFAVVFISILAAIITPTGDIFSVAMMTLPLLVLYFLTVLLAYRMYPKG